MPCTCPRTTVARARVVKQSTCTVPVYTIWRSTVSSISDSWVSGAILLFRDSKRTHVFAFARCQNRPTMATASKPHHAPVVLHVRRASGRAAEVAARRKGPVEEQLH